MSKILITSDWHLEPGLQVSICIDYIDYIMNYCIKNKIEHLFIAGDIFEKSSRIKNEAFLPLFRKLKEIKDTTKIEIYFIVGNHDAIDDYNNSIMEVFSPFGKVISDFDTIEIEGEKIDLLAYTKDQSKVKKNTGSSILITHLEIMNFKFDNDYVAREATAIPIESFIDYKYVFSGHFHRHQHKKNIVYQGSPYQTSGEEEGQIKGFVVYEIGNEWKFVKYSGAPEYITLSPEQILSNEIDYSNKFVSVKLEEKVDNFVQLKHLLYEKGAIEVKPIFLKKESDFEILQENLNFKINDNVEKLLDEHIRGLKIENIDNEILIKLLGDIRSEI